MSLLDRYNNKIEVGGIWWMTDWAQNGTHSPHLVIISATPPFMGLQLNMQHHVMIMTNKKPRFVEFENNEGSVFDPSQWADDKCFSGWSNTCPEEEWKPWMLSADNLTQESIIECRFDRTAGGIKGWERKRIKELDLEPDHLVGASIEGKVAPLGTHTTLENEAWWMKLVPDSIVEMETEKESIINKTDYQYEYAWHQEHVISVIRLGPSETCSWIKIKTAPLGSLLEVRELELPRWGTASHIAPIGTHTHRKLCNDDLQVGQIIECRFDRSAYRLKGWARKRIKEINRNKGLIYFEPDFLEGYPLSDQFAPLGTHTKLEDQAWWMKLSSTSIVEVETEKDTWHQEHVISIADDIDTDEETRSWITFKTGQIGSLEINEWKLPRWGTASHIDPVGTHTKIEHTLIPWWKQLKLDDSIEVKYEDKAGVFTWREEVIKVIDKDHIKTNKGRYISLPPYDDDGKDDQLIAPLGTHISIVSDDDDDEKSPIYPPTSPPKDDDLSPREKIQNAICQFPLSLIEKLTGDYYVSYHDVRKYMSHLILEELVEVKSKLTTRLGNSSIHPNEDDEALDNISAAFRRMTDEQFTQFVENKLKDRKTLRYLYYIDSDNDNTIYCYKINITDLPSGDIEYYRSQLKLKRKDRFRVDEDNDIFDELSNVFHEEKQYLGEYGFQRINNDMKFSDYILIRDSAKEEEEDDEDEKKEYNPESPKMDTIENESPESLLKKINEFDSKLVEGVWSLKGFKSKSNSSALAIILQTLKDITELISDICDFPLHWIEEILETTLMDYNEVIVYIRTHIVKLFPLADIRIRLLKKIPSDNPIRTELLKKLSEENMIVLNRCTSGFTINEAVENRTRDTYYRWLMKRSLGDLITIEDLVTKFKAITKDLCDYALEMIGELLEKNDRYFLWYRGLLSYIDKRKLSIDRLKMIKTELDQLIPLECHELADKLLLKNDLETLHRATSSYSITEWESIRTKDVYSRWLHRQPLIKLKDIEYRIQTFDELYKKTELIRQLLEKYSSYALSLICRNHSIIPIDSLSEWLKLRDMELLEQIKFEIEQYSKKHPDTPQLFETNTKTNKKKRKVSDSDDDDEMKKNQVKNNGPN